MRTNTHGSDMLAVVSIFFVLFSSFCDKKKSSDLVTQKISL